MIEQVLYPATKLFVLDTNVILHDAGCLRNFEDNDIAVPITVLEELDRFKKGNEDINFQARAFLRRLDELTGDVLSSEGISIGDGLGKIRIAMKANHRQQMDEAFLEDCPDHRILDIALTLQHDETPRVVVLVTKDTNLRMKAKSLGIRAQDYSTDKVESMDKLYTGKRLIEGLQTSVLEQFFHGDGQVPADQLDCVRQPIANENHLEVTPLAYIRGRSLQRVFFIVDEAQNLNPHEIKTIITRAGEGTKIVFTGDIQQIDHPYLDSLSNGLSYLIDRMVGQPLFAHVTLEKGERSELAELASNLL